MVQAFVAAAAISGTTVTAVKTAMKVNLRFPIGYKGRKVDLTKPAFKSANAAMDSVVATATKAATKVENYSAAATIEIIAFWKDCDQSVTTLEALAEKYGKSKRSMIAKLAKEKVYVPQKYVTKTGEVPVSKEEHVRTIAAFIGTTQDKLDSLEKANKGVLVALETALKKSAHDYDNAATDTPADARQKAASIDIIAGYVGSTAVELSSLKLAAKAALHIIASALEAAASAKVADPEDDEFLYENELALEVAAS